jgi:hypothetical protein
MADFPWKVWASVKMDEPPLIIEYQQEMGPILSIEAMAVFESSTSYRLVHPKYNKGDILKSNLISFKIKDSK